MVEFILKHRLIVFGLGIILTLLLGINIIFLRIDSSFSTVLPEDDPDFLYNSYVEETFGSSDEIIILIRDNESIYREEVIRLINSIVIELGEIDVIDKTHIFSILSASGFKISDLEDVVEKKVLAIQNLEEFIETDPLVSGLIVNDTGMSTLIFAPVSNQISLSDENLKLLYSQMNSIVNTYSEIYPDIGIFVSGHPIVNAEIMKKMANDLYFLFPIAVIAVAIMLLVILRSISGMLIPLFITFVAVIWTLGLKGLLRSDLTITETVIPVILISVSCADGIHIVSEAFHYMYMGLSSRDAIIKAVNHLWKPVVLTSVTTAIGFASFVFSKGESLRNMGLFLAFGVIVAMVCSLVFIPILFSWYKPITEHKDRKHYTSKYKLLVRVEKLSNSILKKRVIVIISGFVLLGLSVFGMLNINTDTDEIRYFKKENPIRKSAELIEKELGGISVLQIVLESEKPGTFKEMEILQDIQELQNILEARPEVSYTLSIVDYISYFFYLIKGKEEEFYQIPENKLFLKRLFTLLENSDDSRVKNLYAQIDKEFRRAKISVRLKDSNTKVMKELLESVEPQLSELFDESISIHYAGDYIRLKNGKVIVESQILSLSVTLLIILLVLSIIYRSPVWGFIVAMPVIVAVLFNFTIMWVFKVSLNPATSIIAAVGLGVGIDYSIHYFSRFQHLYKKTGDLHKSLIDGVTETVSGIFSNALSVGLGFLILLLSAYRIINDMGWIIALSMITTSLTSLILLPSLLSFVIGTGKKRGKPAE